jgi:hypothetical protein
MRSESLTYAVMYDYEEENLQKIHSFVNTHENKFAQRWVY